MSGLIRSLLKYLPLEIEKDMNWALVVQVVADAELQGRGIDGVLADLISRGNEVFTNETYRPLGVELLTLLRNLLTSHSTSQAASVAAQSR